MVLHYFYRATARAIVSRKSVLKGRRNCRCPKQRFLDDWLRDLRSCAELIGQVNQHHRLGATALLSTSLKVTPINARRGQQSAIEKTKIYIVAQLLLDFDDCSLSLI